MLASLALSSLDEKARAVDVDSRITPPPSRVASSTQYCKIFKIRLSGAWAYQAARK